MQYIKKKKCSVTAHKLADFVKSQFFSVTVEISEIICYNNENKFLRRFFK